MLGSGAMHHTNKLWLSKWSHHVLAIIGIPLYNMVPMFFCLACAQPALPDFWSSLLPDAETLGIPMRLTMATFQTYLLLIMCDVGVVTIYSDLPFHFGSFCMLQVMRYSFAMHCAFTGIGNRNNCFWIFQLQISYHRKAGSQSKEANIG